MTVLRIEHPIFDYSGWKKAFDSDPIDRKKSGVKSYRIYRPAIDPKYVIIDLLFDSVTDAENTLTALQKLWGKVEGTVMANAKTNILEVTEDKIC